MSNLLTNTGFANLSVSLTAQQASILDRISGDPADGETYRIGESPEVPKVRVTEELQSLEDAVLDRLVGAIPEGETPRLLLFGPGSSKSDPLYGLRFLAKTALRTGRLGRMGVYDVTQDPYLPGYYARLPWGGHACDLTLGPEGNFARLKDGRAHLVLAIHPGVEFQTLFESFSENLVHGGIALLQSSVPVEFSSPQDYDLFLKMLSWTMNGILEFLGPPHRSPLFRSFFAERSSDVQVLALVKTGPA